MRAEAGQRDAELHAGSSRGFWHGVPLGIKDLVEVRGEPTTHGFFNVAGAAIAKRDELFVARLRAEGGIVVGKTNTPQFGLGSHTFNSLGPATANAHDTTRSAGGSSGGAAVAVALGELPVADGSDFMGSLRNPPGWNGVLALRPGPGVIPTLDDPADACGVVGPIARTVSDLRALFITMAGGAVTTAPKVRSQPPRLAWLSDLEGYLPFESGIAEACWSTLGDWGSAGANVKDVRVDDGPPFGLSHDLWRSWLAIRAHEVGRGLVPYADASGLSAAALFEIDSYRRLTTDELARARRFRSWLRASLLSLLEGADALVLPTAQVWPFPIERTWPTRIGDTAMDTYHRWMEVSTLATLSGLPVVVVPGRASSDGLPMGLQLLGRPSGEPVLLAVADWAERHEVFTVAAPSTIEPVPYAS